MFAACCACCTFFSSATGLIHDGSPYTNVSAATMSVSRSTACWFSGSCMNVSTIDNGLPGCARCSSSESKNFLTAGSFRTEANALLDTIASYCSRSRSVDDTKAASIGIIDSPVSETSAADTAVRPVTNRAVAMTHAERR